ncbi:MAG: hypothetical protein ACOYB1_09855 [Limnohabitans sp.]
MLKSSYVDAKLRNVTPVCPCRDRLGLGFVLPDSQLLRLALSTADALALQRCLDDYTKSAAGCQSPESSLMPNNPKSVPSDGMNV